MLSFKRVETDERSLQTYAELFRTCFPTASHLTPRYLRWLYVDNPCGKVVGMDATSQGELAAHYVCVPTRVSFFGTEVNALLSLNTATHPNFRGQGLFTKLAEGTYKFAEESGFSLVYGVANANSTPGFTRKLGFQLVAPLEARLGFGRQLEIDWDRALKTAMFRRLWDTTQLAWRARNPSNPVSTIATADGHTGLYAKTDKGGIFAWSELPLEMPRSSDRLPNVIWPRLFLGLNPRACVTRKVSLVIPDRFRPSPLNFIVRMLGRNELVDRNVVSFSFIDFDAY